MPKTKALLSKKEKAFADLRVAQPKLSDTEVAAQTYQVKNRKVASVIAAQNLVKPRIMKYLDKYSELAEITVIDVMQSSRELKEEPGHAGIALKAADSVLDRLHGKATQRTETTSTTVNLNLSLSDVVSTSVSDATTEVGNAAHPS